ncbi:ATP synthase subunit delta [Mycoplasmopsis canis UFG4]|uniref:ATP synthase subunit delta n=2 Tax=Mycoplasmopsis canis TaxID=29555 RepID=I1A6T3_9BACT|nr:ATP synthase F1 subunit delta [Mycoplasmopsis canis]AKF41161.1 ATP synthase subunit delta [Mycoplasmopsis canis]AMD81275.1 ATP synthase subunit delta [Mycoplasmopsis canis PG 14]EIE40444.1 ATP synthase subunit delta [Mycoplasmopsis canis UF31]EIE40584.1 ATP synthase subunit delta [Mycoplasmopsis canis PG 14]EIE40728.1 ATP synthase subunit delta [Mycoplasmopsis canis UF33]
MLRKTHASAYAVAIFDLVQEENKFAKLESEFELLKDLINNQPEFIDYLKNDTIPESARLETIDLAFKDFDWIVINSLKVIVQRKATSFLKKIIIEYLKLSNKELKIRYIDVISAFPLTNTQLEQIKDKLQKTTRRTIKITNHIDKSLISGFKIVSRTEVLELNYNKELEKLKNQIIWKKEEV